jgi:hypothetical protein
MSAPMPLALRWLPDPHQPRGTAYRLHAGPYGLALVHRIMHGASQGVWPWACHWMPPDRLHPMSGREATADAARAAVRAAYLRDLERRCDPVWNLPPGAYRYTGPVVAHLAPDDILQGQFQQSPQAVTGWLARAPQVGTMGLRPKLVPLAV